MAGNNSIRGDETITFTDNMSFDGTERDGKLDTDGQIWVGSSTLPKVRKAAFTTTDSSLTVTYSEPTALTASLDLAINGPVSIANGGTNQTTYTTGDILYASAANTLAKLAAGTNSDVLTLASGVPSWAAPVASVSAGDIITQVYLGMGS